MFHTYLITGASGFLGRAVLAELKKKGVPIRALVMENDPLAAGLPEGVSVFYGDVCDDASLERFFSGADNGTCVIHCAGIVSVASRPGERIYQVNVCGTNNILRHCERARAAGNGDYRGRRIFAGCGAGRLRQEQGHCNRSCL